MSVSFDHRDEEMIFSGGRRLYVHANIIGIDGDGSLFYGYDGRIDCSALPREELIELADEAIARWTKLKASL